MEDVLSKPIVTSKAEALPVIRQAFLDKKLQCFKPDRGTCQYRDSNGNPCAIGTLIPDGHEIILFRNYNGVSSLMDEGVIQVPFEDRKWFSEVQSAHDYLSSAMQYLESGKIDHWNEKLAGLLEAA